MLGVNFVFPVPREGQVRARTEAEAPWAAELTGLRTLRDAEEAGDDLAFQELGPC